MHTMQILRGDDPNRRLSNFRFSLCLWIFLSGIGVATAQIPPAVVSLTAASGGQGWTLDGPEFLARAGAAIDGDCDLNGDGFLDLLIGATGAGTSDQGMAFVVFGSPSGATPPSSLNNAGLRMTGEVSGDAAGASVACAGDVDADGFDDVLIGAPFADAPGVPNTGVAYLVYGGENLPSAMSLSNAGLRDINGDGLGEVIFGAPGADFGVVDSGGAYVVFGRSSGLPANFALSSLNGANGFRIQGATADDFAGQTVSRVGDVNQDGIADLVVGAPEADPNATMAAGRVYALFGNDFISNDPLFQNGFE